MSTDEQVNEQMASAMREANWRGYIGFTIKAKDTEVNQSIHDSFTGFCKIESGNDYTVGLKVLLDYYQADMKYEALWEEIKVLKDEITQLRIKVDRPKTEEKRDFF